MDFKTKQFSVLGSGPIELQEEFYNWLELPNLKYLNLQDSNIKIYFNWLHWLRKYFSLFLKNF